MHERRCRQSRIPALEQNADKDAMFLVCDANINEKDMGCCKMSSVTLTCFAVVLYFTEEKMLIKELELDLKDYITGGSVFRRRAVRGIIRRENEYLIIHGKYGDYKFPGGGMKKGEERIDTLLREVAEETGYHVILDSVGDYILVHEKRKGDPDDLLEMDSWYYICDVEEEAGERNLDEYEQEYDYRVEWLSLDEIIRKNEEVTAKENIPWVDRELMVMKELRRLS